MKIKSLLLGLCLIPSSEIRSEPTTIAAVIAVLTKMGLVAEVGGKLALTTQGIIVAAFGGGVIATATFKILWDQATARLPENQRAKILNIDFHRLQSQLNLTKEILESRTKQYEEAAKQVNDKDAFIEKLKNDIAVFIAIYEKSNGDIAQLSPEEQKICEHMVAINQASSDQQSATEKVRATA